MTSLQVYAGETDSILIFDATTGACVDTIHLDQPSPQPEEYATALVFGPGGHLFVPITSNGPGTGGVRIYNVTAKTFTYFVAPCANGGSLIAPSFLTFLTTNPTTLAYRR